MENIEGVSLELTDSQAQGKVNALEGAINRLAAKVEDLGRRMSAMFGGVGAKAGQAGEAGAKAGERMAGGLGQAKRAGDSLDNTYANLRTRLISLSAGGGVFGEMASGLGRVSVAAGVASGALMTYLTIMRKAGAEAKEIWELSESFGMTASRTQDIVWSFKKSGLDGQDMELFMIRLKEAMAEVAAGEEQATLRFKAFGIEAKDLIGLGLEERIMKVAQAIRSLGSESARTAAITSIGGGFAVGSEKWPILASKGASSLNEFATGTMTEAPGKMSESNMLYARKWAQETESIVKGVWAAIRDTTVDVSQFYNGLVRNGDWEAWRKAAADREAQMQAGQATSMAYAAAQKRITDAVRDQQSAVKDANKELEKQGKLQLEVAQLEREVAALRTGRKESSTAVAENEVMSQRWQSRNHTRQAGEARNDAAQWEQEAARLKAAQKQMMETSAHWQKQWETGKRDLWTSAGDYTKHMAEWGKRIADTGAQMEEARKKAAEANSRAATLDTEALRAKESALKGEADLVKERNELAAKVKESATEAEAAEQAYRDTIAEGSGDRPSRLSEKADALQAKAAKLMEAWQKAEAYAAYVAKQYPGAGETHTQVRDAASVAANKAKTEVMQAMEQAQAGINAVNVERNRIDAQGAEEQQKLADAENRRIERLDRLYQSLNNVASIQREYNRRVGELDELKGAGRITQAEYDLAKRKLARDTRDASLQAEDRPFGRQGSEAKDNRELLRLERDLNATSTERSTASEELNRRLKDNDAGYFESFRVGCQRQVADWGSRSEQIAAIGAGTMDSVASNTTGAFAEMIKGTKDYKAAFSDMALSIGEDLMQMILKMQMQQALQSAMGYLGGGGTSAGAPSYHVGGRFHTGGYYDFGLPQLARAERAHAGKSAAMVGDERQTLVTKPGEVVTERDQRRTGGGDNRPVVNVKSFLVTSPRQIVREGLDKDTFLSMVGRYAGEIRQMTSAR